MLNGVENKTKKHLLARIVFLTEYSIFFFVSEISKSLSGEKQNNIVILEEKHYIVDIANMTLTKVRV